MSTNNRRTELSYPPVVYDLTQLLLFPMNYVIAGLCHLQPDHCTWNEDDFATQDVEGSGRPLSELKADLLAGRDAAYEQPDLVRLYDSLPTVSARQDVIGRSWRGRIIRTDRSVLDLAEWALVRPLGRLGLGWGKRYLSADRGDPLFLRWADRLYFPVPAWGNVGVTDVRWRGETTATMNYDHQPWKDYFRRLSADGEPTVLLGVWTHKHLAGGWFLLTQDGDACADAQPATRKGGRPATAEQPPL